MLSLSLHRFTKINKQARFVWLFVHDLVFALWYKLLFGDEMLFLQPNKLIELKMESIYLFAHVRLNLMLMVILEDRKRHEGANLNLNL